MINRTERVLNRVNKYLSLMRYRYSTEEKLMRLHILSDYYKSLNMKASEEKLTSVIETAESLGKDTVLPLKVRGVFLTEGRPLKKYYLADELKSSVVNPVNSKFPLMLDHKDKEAGKVIGMVDKIEYDDVLQGLRWWGHINDDTFARNVADGAITQVSATIFSMSDFDEVYGLLGRNLTFKELSLVMNGADPGNFVEAY